MFRTKINMACALSILALVSLPILPAHDAAAQDDPHAACAAPPIHIPPELLERPVPLRSGIGNSHEPVSTKSAEAQAYYDQGLNYLESYVWIEAARSFRQALRVDPGLAMAHLGLSYTHSGLDDPEAARRSLADAKALAAGLSDRERRRLTIREKQLEAMDDLGDASRFLAYRKAIDEALAAHLDDAPLWLLRGNAEESNASGRGQRGNASSIAFYQAVLRLVPDHATAHHYLVHSYETVGRIDKALEHGESYARLAPSIPHAAHMWGHDLRRVGRVDDAIGRFLEANRLERAYHASEGIDPALDWHHAHNLDLLAACYEHKGQMQLAEKTLRASAALPPLSAYRAFNMRELPNFLIHRGRYAEALVEARALSSSGFSQARTVGHALAGHALLWLGRTEDAAGELEAAQQALEAVPRVTAGIDPPRSMVEPWVQGLRGDLLLRTGHREEGRAILKEVVLALRSAPGPDAWSQALFRLESMALGAMQAGDWELASFVADQMVEHDAAYGGSHLTLGLVLGHAGEREAAAREMEAARRLWRDADGGLLDSLPDRADRASRP